MSEYPKEVCDGSGRTYGIDLSPSQPVVCAKLYHVGYILVASGKIFRAYQADGQLYWEDITWASPPTEPDTGRDPKVQAAQKRSADRKNAPMASGLLDYFPDALEAVARLSKQGNDKHNAGEPLHWSREKSTDHADCIMRHMKDRGHWDDDNDCLHDVAVAWRALAQAQLAIEKWRQEH
jgi:hypothetical protein